MSAYLIATITKSTGFPPAFFASCGHAAPDELHVAARPRRLRRLAVDRERQLCGTERDDDLVVVVLRARRLIEGCIGRRSIRGTARTFRRDFMAVPRGAMRGAPPCRARQP